MFGLFYHTHVLRSTPTFCDHALARDIRRSWGGKVQRVFHSREPMADGRRLYGHNTDDCTVTIYRARTVVGRLISWYHAFVQAHWSARLDEERQPNIKEAPRWRSTRSNGAAHRKSKTRLSMRSATRRWCACIRPRAVCAPSCWQRSSSSTPAAASRIAL